MRTKKIENHRLVDYIAEGRQEFRRYGIYGDSAVDVVSPRVRWHSQPQTVRELGYCCMCSCFDFETESCRFRLLPYDGECVDVEEAIKLDRRTK